LCTILQVGPAANPLIAVGQFAPSAASITELSFHGILLSAPFGPKSVTYVSGTFCYPYLGTDNSHLSAIVVSERVEKNDSALPWGYLSEGTGQLTRNDARSREFLTQPARLSFG
jgi:hypothetical protein